MCPTCTTPIITIEISGPAETRHFPKPYAIVTKGLASPLTYDYGRDTVCKTGPWTA